MGINDDMIDLLRSCLENKNPVPTAIHNTLMDYFRKYTAIGGMPEAVQRYVDTKDFREVDMIQKNILRGYQYDIAHYANAKEKIKAEKCYLTLGKQLLDKENHKFQYKEIEKGAKAQKYYSSIEWLLRADIIHLCRLVSDVRYDLDDYAREDFFRAYTTDMSLLLAMKDMTLKQNIVENTIQGNTKGGIYECAIADALHKKGYQLYFYKNETKKRELDFIIQMNGKVIPIEVKSSNNRSNSLNAVIKANPQIEIAYKFVDDNIGISDDRIVTLPLYMASLLPDSGVRFFTAK
jgi:predicted AAA+ superfamily ATPase